MSYPLIPLALEVLHPLKFSGLFSDPLKFFGLFSDPLNFSLKISHPLKNTPTGYPDLKKTGPLTFKLTLLKRGQINAFLRKCILFGIAFVLNILENIKKNIIDKQLIGNIGNFEIAKLSANFILILISVHWACERKEGKANLR